MQDRSTNTESRREEHDAAAEMILNAEKFKASVAQPKGIVGNALTDIMQENEVATGDQDISR